MAKDKRSTKRRVKKNVERGQAHIQASFNNTIVTLTDTEGNHSFFGPDDVLVEAEFAEIVHNDWYCGILTDDGCDYLLQNGEQLSLGGKITEMDHGLISNEDGLYELYTGGKLLSGYSIYAYCDGYVYAGIYGIWTVFRVEITE